MVAPNLSRINILYLETHPKAIPLNLVGLIHWLYQVQPFSNSTIESFAVTDFRVRCEDICDQALNQMLFQYHPTHVGHSTQ